MTTTWTDPAHGSPLPRTFFARDAERVARDLLGCVLVSRVRGACTAGRIVEVEAYTGPEDPACHSFGWRRTARTEPMYAPPGTIYVYRSYGVHWCFNLVTDREEYPAAVLVRALEPISGLTAMRRRRRGRARREWCGGPGRLCQALGITGTLSGRPLGDELVVTQPTPRLVLDVGSGPRIGLSVAAEEPLRFFERGSPWLSRPG